MPNLSEILAIVCAALLAIIIALGVWLHIDGIKIDGLNAKVAACEGANKALDAAVTEQDAAVKKLAADEAALEQAAVKAEQSAAKRDAPISAAIDRLKVARPSGDVCKSTDSLFNAYIGGK